MFQSFFNGLSGMFAFSKNLDNVSNNISNMNTPGFKANDTFYRSLTSDDATFGTQVSGEQPRFQNGELRQTGNDTDVAIAGKGFFVLLSGDEVLYTRAGQFEFNNEGVLIDSVSGAQVAGILEDGQLKNIDISNLRILAPEATTTIAFRGNLSSEATSHVVSNVTVFDSQGGQHDLTFTFSENSAALAGSWLVSVTDANGASIHEGEIRFANDGTPLASHSSLSLQIPLEDGSFSDVSVNFGQDDGANTVTSFAAGATSTLAATVEDGFGTSVLASIEFDDQGTLKLNYANGQVVDGPTLALADFANMSALSVEDGSAFRASDITSRTLGMAGENGFGAVIAGSIELSNVDLSREFADMLLIQRGYQASSRILNVANQLMEQLYENTRGR